MVVGLLYKKLGPHPYDEGFPTYLLFVVMLVALPSAMFFRAVVKFVNLRALVFALQSILFIGLVWEVTLALPYGWWGYRPQQMVGIFLTPWSNLPIEAAFLWGAAAWSNIGVYEVFKLWMHRPERRGAARSRAGRTRGTH